MWRAIAVALLLTAPLGGQAQFIGVLEHPQCNHDQTRVVRPLFQLDGQVWNSLASGTDVQQYPRKWFVAGVAPQASVEVSPPASHAESAWTFSRDFLLNPVEGATLPYNPNQGGTYAGWCEAPRNKPILVTSKPVVLHQLRAGSPPMRTPSRELRNAFLISLPFGKVCTNYDDPRPTTIRQTDLAINEDFVLPGGTRLIAISLKKQLSECGSELGGVEQPRWFVLEPTPRFVGASMDYVATVDFGGDAHIFWFSGYNEDGYLLFKSDFGKPQRFTWKYH